MLDFDLTTITVTIVNLLILFFLLRRFFWKPVSELLEKRRQMVNADLDSAKQDREEAQRLLDEHRQLIAGNKSEAAKIIDDAIRQADLRKAEIIAHAGREATALLERAKAEIALERVKALEELRSEISGLAVSVAEKTLARTLTPRDKELIFTAALEEMDHAN